MSRVEYAAGKKIEGRKEDKKGEKRIERGKEGKINSMDGWMDR